MNRSFDLHDYDITVSEVHHNLPPSVLYEHSIRYEKDASITENGGKYQRHGRSARLMSVHRYRLANQFGEETPK